MSSVGHGQLYRQYAIAGDSAVTKFGRGGRRNRKRRAARDRRQAAELDALFAPMPLYSVSYGRS